MGGKKEEEEESSGQQQSKNKDSPATRLSVAYTIKAANTHKKKRR